MVALSGLRNEVNGFWNWIETDIRPLLRQKLASKERKSGAVNTEEEDEIDESGLRWT